MKYILILLAIFTNLSYANPIDDKCPQHVIWGAPQIAHEGNNQYLCRIGYAVNYNYTTKVAYYAVEVVRPENLNKAVPRKDEFREDPEVPPQYRSTLKDYQASGFDRGHIAPAADLAFSAQAMSESFFLTNMMPQVPGNNRGIWKYTEEMTRFYVQKYNTPMSVITGTIFTPDSKIMGNGVKIPSYVYKIVFNPKNLKVIAFLFPNEKLDPKTIEQYIVSIADVEKYTGIDFFPLIPAEYKQIENTKANFKDW